jgi:hypothetical protein
LAAGDGLQSQILEWSLKFAPQIDFLMLKSILAQSGHSIPASINTGSS